MAAGLPGSASVPSATNPVPPLARDPWAWVSALALVPLLWRCAGTRMCEPVAEDFDMLRRALLEPWHGFLNGGGSVAFWRPVSFQLYFRVFGELILDHPRVVAGIHAALLALVALLIYRVLRGVLPGWAAAAAASFPLLAESSRTLITWPSHFGDLGALVFSAFAVHEASRRRLWTSLAALAMALLCKEVACVTALLVPFLPRTEGESRAERTRWLIGSGLTLVAWAATYQFVRQGAGLELPHGLERDASLLHTSMFTRLLWAWRNSLLAAASLMPKPGPWDGAAFAAVFAIFGAAVLVFVRSAAARERLRALRGWLAWSAAWFVLASASLAPIFPLWAPVRSQFAGVGLGVAAATFTAAASPLLTAALVVTRLSLLAAAPASPTWITPEPADHGAFVEFVRISRLQRLVGEARDQLTSHYPRLPHGATIGVRNLPLSTEYAFGGAHAVQVWYRDSTLKWITFPEWQRDSAQAVVAFVDYQPNHRPQVVLLDSDAMREQMVAAALLRRGEWPDAIAAYNRSDSLQTDKDAAILLGDNAGRRAYCLAQLRRFDEAESEARIALNASGLDIGARYVLAITLLARHRTVEAAAQLDTVIATDPHYEDAAMLRQGVRSGAFGVDSTGHTR